TRFSRDWSSDVCSSDLNSQQLKPGEFTSVGQIRDKEGIVLDAKLYRTVDAAWIAVDPKGQSLPLGSAGTSLANVEGKMEVDLSEIGRASGRERVRVEGA